MKEAVTYVTQSKYFSPAFNAAIFDGPIRIYFAQYQESQALKLYFHLQERFQSLRKNARGLFRDRTRNIFVMLYPTVEMFDASFGGQRDAPVTAASVEAGAGAWSAKNFVRAMMGEDFVIGVRGPMDDSEYDDLDAEMDAIIRSAESSELTLGPAEI